MLALVAGAVVALSLAAVGAPALAAERSDAAGVVLAGLDDFEFESFSADYYLDVDADGRSTLTTVETFVAIFPENQNRGMRRAIPGGYQGAPTDVAIVSVTGAFSDQGMTSDSAALPPSRTRRRQDRQIAIAAHGNAV